jgi:hypothetical protein
VLPSRRTASIGPGDPSTATAGPSPRLVNTSLAALITAASLLFAHSFYQDLTRQAVAQGDSEIFADTRF